MRKIRTPTLVTPDLLLRPPRLRDVWAVYRGLRDPAMRRFVPTQAHYRPWHALAFVLRAIRGRWTGRRVDYLSFSRATGRLVGCNMLYRIRWAAPRQAEIGQWVVQAHWGDRLGTQAADAFTPYAFDTLGIHRLVAQVNERNAQAVQATEVADRQWVYEGTLRDALFHKGRFHSLRVYCLRATDPSMAPWLEWYRAGDYTPARGAGA